MVAVMRSSVQVERDGMREGTHEQTGILISLSAQPTYSPFALSALTTSFRAWNRFIPYSPQHVSLDPRSSEAEEARTWNSGPAFALSVPSSLRMLIKSSLCLMPTS